MIAVALVGYGGVGKDVLGQIMVVEHGFVRYAKGDYIKQAVEYVNPCIDDQLGYPSECRHYPLSELLAAERLKQGPMPSWLDVHDAVKRQHDDLRRYQQRIADAVVEVTGRDPWTEKLWDDIDAAAAERVVMTRMCLPIEAETWKRRGGLIWRVTRPGHGPANGDHNEVALDGWDFDAVIPNCGSVDELRGTVRAALDAAA